MNRLQNFTLRHEKPLRYALVIIGFSFIIIGIASYFLKSWLLTIGDLYSSDGCCCSCRQYIDLYTKPLIILGSFLSFPLLFQYQIIKLYEKFAIKPKSLLAIYLILIFITLGYISYVSFHNFPYSYDEYNYLYQAKIFSQGKLFIDIPEKFRPFKEEYMILRDNKLFSKYPPGFPFLLTIGVLLNIPGLINPIIAVLTLVILYSFVKSFLGTKYGLLSVIIVSTTPYFLGYSASYYSQPSALMLTALIFLLVRRYELTSNSNYLLLLGLVSGYLFMTRPLDSFCVVVPSCLYLAYILYKNENLKKISYSILTFVMVFTLFVIYNYRLTGKIGIAVYPVFKTEFKVYHNKADPIITKVYKRTRRYIRDATKYIPQLFYKYFLIQTGLLIPFFALFGIFKFKSKWKWVLVLNFIMLVIFYNFSRGLGWPLYGARYYYSGFISLGLLAAFTFKYIIDKIKNKRHVMYLLTFVLCINIVFSFKLMNDYSYRINVKLSLVDDIANHCPENSIVILDRNIINETVTNCKRHVKLIDLGSEKRNMFMNTSRLIAYMEDPSLDLSKINSYFPNHSVCYYNYGILNELQSYDVTSQ